MNQHEEQKPNNIQKSDRCNHSQNYQPHPAEKSWLIQVAEPFFFSGAIEKNLLFFGTFFFKQKESTIAPGRKYRSGITIFCIFRHNP
jgi:hypothetical protein